MLKSILSTGAFNISSQLLIFCVEIMIARLLMPSDFGAFALALIIVDLFSVLSVKSYAMAFIQNKVSTDRDLSSIAAFCFALSLIYVGGSLLLIEPLSLLWGGEAFSLSYSIMVFALPIITLEYIYRNALMKKECFWQVGAAELASVIAYVIVVSLLAFKGYGFYSLIYAYLLRQAVKFIIILMLASKSYQIFSSLHINSIIKLGRMSFAMTLQSLFLFSTSNTDRYFINLSSGAAGVGLYTRALKLLQMPLNQIVRNVSSVLYVEFSKKQNDTDYLTKTFLLTTSILAMLFIPASTLLVIYSDLVVHIIYGDKWLAMVPILQVLVIGAVISSFSIIIGDLLKSQGIVYREIISNALAFTVLVILSFLLHESHAAVGIAYAFVFSQLMFISCQVGFISKAINLKVTNYLKAFFMPLVASVIIYLTNSLLLNYISRELALVILSFCLISSIIAIALLYKFRKRDTQKFLSKNLL